MGLGPRVGSEYRKTWPEPDPLPFLVVLCWRRKSLTKKKEEEARGFPSESESQGELVEASHRRVGAWRVLAIVVARCDDEDQKVGATCFHGCCGIEARESSRRPVPWRRALLWSQKFWQHLLLQQHFVGSIRIVLIPFFNFFFSFWFCG